MDTSINAVLYTIAFVSLKTPSSLISVIITLLIYNENYFLTYILKKVISCENRSVYDKRYYEKIKLDPEKLQRKREYEKVRMRLKRKKIKQEIAQGNEDVKKKNNLYLQQQNIRQKERNAEKKEIFKLINIT